MAGSLTKSVLAVMRKAAEQAILPRYQSLAAHEISIKAADDVVTIADQESEAILAEGLARLCPEATIIGEEAAHADPSLTRRLGDALCWIIDPLDGTNNFAAGNAPFGVLVALSERGETIAGWIYDPLTGRSCHAERGRGAFIDGERIHSLGSEGSKPIVAISLALADPIYRDAIRDILEPKYELVDIPRCAAEQYPRLVLGQNDVAFSNRTFAWDHAAGVLFLNEAGGKAARYDGSPYRVDDQRDGLLAAATPALWDELTERLARLRASARS